MGNCQAAEVATVLIQHPGGGRTERAYWALSAASVMAANPGHYVAAVITVPPTTTGAAGTASSGAAAPAVKHLKLLRPDDTLLLGRVYRLVSFEEVLREFASKRHVKLSRVTIKVKEEKEKEKEETKPAKPRRRRGSSGGVAPEEYSHRSLAKVMRQSDDEQQQPEPATPKTENGDAGVVAETDDGDLEEALLPQQGMVIGRRFARQWRPALQSIAEG